jgi:membrane protein
LIATWLQALLQGPTEKFGIGLIISILLALWSMWAASGMLMTAVNVCYGEEETRGFVSFNLRALALGAGLALFGTTALALFAVLPEISPNVGDGLKDQAAAVWAFESAGLAATSIPSVNLTP